MGERKVLVTITQSNVQRGEDVELPGLGLFKNGVPREVTDVDMVTFRAFHPELEGVNPADLAEDGEAVPETSTGLVLWHAFKGSSIVSVHEELDKDEEQPEKTTAKAATVKSPAPVGKKTTGAKGE